MNRIPNFFIVGTPKAGTTSLHHYLEEHPDIFMSPVKETNYFSHNEIAEQGLYYNEEHISTPEQYMEQFAGAAREKAIGESSVSYLFYSSVPGKIKAFNPEARIIIVLRNPVDRGFSHYLMDKRLGFVNLSLKEVVYSEDQTDASNLFYQQYISLGYYYDQVKRYFDTFGKDRVKVLFYEDLTNDINSVVKEIYSFLEVDDTYLPATDQKHNVFLAPKNRLVEKLYTVKSFRTITKKIFGEKLQNSIKSIFFEKKNKPGFDQSLKTKMKELFKDDILKTSILLGKDLSQWLQ